MSLLLELGTPPHVVQAIARHADLDVTMRIYAHTNLDSMRKAVDKIDWGAADQPLLHRGYIPANPRAPDAGSPPNRWSAQRKRRDSNPRPFRDSRFQGECIRPLCHASATQPNACP